jgi:hypothetical protein
MPVSRASSHVRVLAMFLVLCGIISVGHASAQATGQAVPPRAERAQLESLAGEYEAGAIVMKVILLQDDTLTLFFPGQQLYRLDLETGLRYKIRELSGFAVEFVRDAKGAVNGMTVDQAPPQGDFFATRKTAGAVPAAPKTAQASKSGVDRAQLESLAGEYEAGTIVMKVILLQDGSLTLFFPGQQLYHLDLETGLRFKFRELAGFAVEFIKDASGAVTGMAVDQAPPQHDFYAARKKS